MKPLNSACVQPGQPVAQLPVALRLLGAGEFGDRIRHPIRVAVDVEAAAVGELCAIRRVNWHQFQPVRTVFADRGEGFVDDVGHGQHRRPGIELIAVDVGAPGPSTGPALPLDDGHFAAASGQVQRRGQSRETGADHDDPGVWTFHAAHYSVRSVHTAAMFVNAARTGSPIRSWSSSSSADVDPVADRVLDPLHGSGRDDQASASGRWRRRRGRRRSSARSSCLRVGGSASWCAAMTTLVALRSTRSCPSGLPVTVSEPNTPSRSSRSWKASPIASP